ncbi:uncharacterized protein [Halyomorpha halys]|uniref:uncharacterized protein isoform X2 n=1 Tax=Halyomorpha halys TaxID=286706 RepID=UPI0006D4E417|nr:intracellular protein transport protein USO1 isoform X2 [Halyomorpha halys]
MSDSDDTDVLLLARPSIFIEDNTGVDPLASVEIVDNLISHLSELETRVSIIESVSSPRSFKDYRSISPMVLNDLETSLEQSMQSVASDDVETTQVNLITSPSDDHLRTPTLMLNTSGLCSNTESSNDLTALYAKDPPKYKESLLKEIDTYLSNVSSSRSNMESDLYSIDRNKLMMGKPTESVADSIIRRTSPDDRLDLPAVDKLLREMEATHQEIENKLKMREAEYGFLNQKSFSNVGHRRSFPLGDNNLVPDRRNGSYEPHSSPLKSSGEVDRPKSLEDLAGKRDVYLVGSSHNSDSEDARKNNDVPEPIKKDPFRASSNLENRRRFPSPRRRLFGQPESYGGRKTTSGASSSTTHDQDIQRRNHFSHFGAGDGPHLSSPRKIAESKIQKEKLLKHQYNRNNLLSLAELWRSERDSSDEDSKKLRQKLEEEKLRRIHLENTIQELQRRVLEEQEKLAVAVKVDEGKDKAIAQITEAWKQMVNHWRDIEADRHAMSQVVIKERAGIKHAHEEMSKKVERWEKEVSQALDLAAGYKSKCEFLETELSVTKEANDERVAQLESRLKEIEAELQKLNEERKILTDKLNISEEEHLKEKKLVELAHEELSSLQEVLKKSEAELSIVQEQRELLTTRLREEKGRNTTLEQHKNSLQETLEDMKQRLNEAEELIKNLTSTLERTKTELRGVYQNQLEAVVKEKLEEFQNQLDQAQASMKAEVNEARKQAHERAVAEQQALVNSHLIEMRRLETIHKEEMKALEEKLAESERRREKLESGKKEIAHRLHGVMETQWQQALSIITSEISMKQSEDNGRDHNLEDQNQRLAGAQSTEDLKYNKEVQVANRRQSKQETLLKYIQMLLDKQPGKPIDSSSSTQWPDLTQSDVLDDSVVGEQKWNELISGKYQYQGSSDSSKPPLYLKKPPWK